LGPDVPDEYLMELRHDGVSYLFTPVKSETGYGSLEEKLRHAMNTLWNAFGIRSLMLRGGCTSNGAFLKTDPIDEISLIVYPGIDGLAGIPTLFEYAEEPNECPAARKVLKHMVTETLDSGLGGLRYKLGKEDVPVLAPGSAHGCALVPEAKCRPSI
jgi:5-amino-6-(5-phosphoribosylamino)uracil reductase